MSTALVAKARRYAPVILPLAAIGLARLFTYSDWAAANATLAAILFAWIVADGLGLAIIAKAKDRRPDPRALLGALAAASVLVPIWAAGPVRQALFSMPPLLAAMALTVAAYLAWSSIHALAAWREKRSLEAALGQILPALAVKMTLHELRMLHLAVFRWNVPRDIPEGAQAFAYHRYLNPMIGVLLALQLFELAIVHFFVMMWNPLVAWILFGLSTAGALWLVALMKSFRIRPVLVDGQTLRVRSGAMIDAAIPRGAIAAVAPSFSEATRKRKDTLDTAILAAPNVCLELAHPVAIPTFFGGTRMVERVAMRIEDAPGLIAALGLDAR